MKSAIDQGVTFEAANVQLEADVAVPPDPRGVVLFAHGSGSSRHSPRNRSVARELQQGGLGTVLADLLTRREEEVDVQTAEFRFDARSAARGLPSGGRVFLVHLGGP